MVGYGTWGFSILGGFLAKFKRLRNLRQFCIGQKMETLILGDWEV